MKTILVYGDTEDEILDKIEVEEIVGYIWWRGAEYTVSNSELGHLVKPESGKTINDYKGTFFFYYDD